MHRGFNSIRNAEPVASSRMKSRPWKPERRSRALTRLAASVISGWLIKRTIVAAPVGPRDAITSTATKPSNSPRQHASIALAGLPGINLCRETTGLEVTFRVQKASGSPLTRYRFQAVPGRWGFNSARMLPMASSADETIFTPVPPQVPSSFTTAGLAGRYLPSSDIGGRNDPAGIRDRSSQLTGDVHNVNTAPNRLIGRGIPERGFNQWAKARVSLKGFVQLPDCTFVARNNEVRAQGGDGASQRLPGVKCLDIDRAARYQRHGSTDRRDDTERRRSIRVG